LAPLKPLPYREVKRGLEASGFVERSQKGSHVKFVRQTEDVVRTTVVPRHREIAVGTLRSILRQAGITPSDFEPL
jgi:predicted RNA binding protein YcfA (HicA-like mRNA interferase family)